MSYQLLENGASIQIINQQQEVLLMKHHIVGITVIGNNLVRITGAAPLRSILLDYRDVVQPLCSSAQDLAIQISAMVTDCVCGSSGNGGG